MRGHRQERGQGVEAQVLLILCSNIAAGGTLYIVHLPASLAEVTGGRPLSTGGDACLGKTR